MDSDTTLSPISRTKKNVILATVGTTRALTLFNNAVHIIMVFFSHNLSLDWSPVTLVCKLRFITCISIHYNALPLSTLSCFTRGERDQNKRLLNTKDVDR